MGELDIGELTKSQFLELFERVPFAYIKTVGTFRTLERKEAGSGGLFAIMVSDLCKGCGECVFECPYEALEMAPETEEINADHVSGTNFLDLLPDTSAKYLGRFDPDDPVGSAAAHLKNHLMVRSNYEALVSGDGYHYEAVVVGACFEGKSMVQQQKMVYSVLNEHITSGAIHALTIKTYTPEQWENAQKN